MTRMVIVLMSVALTFSLASEGRGSFGIRVVDPSGAPFPDVLVIVKSLEGEGEMFRALTDATGSVSGRKLPFGL